MDTFIGGYGHNMAAAAAADSKGAAAFVAYTATRMFWPVGRQLIAIIKYKHMKQNIQRINCAHQNHGLYRHEVYAGKLQASGLYSQSLAQSCNTVANKAQK